MPSMTRYEFIKRYEADEVDVKALRRDPTSSQAVTRRLTSADTNGDGVIRGAREISKLFTAVDHFDRNGDWHSVSTTNRRNTASVSGMLTSIERATMNNEPSVAATTMLEKFLDQHPAMKTHQDMINYCLRAGGGDWARGQSFAKHFGLDLNLLVRDRGASLRSAPATPTPTPNDSAVTTATEGRVPSGIYGNVFRRHEQQIRSLEPTPEQVSAGELGHFERTWASHQPRYEDVAQRTGVPAPLIAAIHYRESSSNFNTYLHQGDPLGRPAVHHPANIPIFHRWEDAAVHALESKSWLRDQLGMNAGTDDLRSIATYAEAYNGLGYFNRGLTSPYVYAGTNVYGGGRYVADGVFDSNSWDRRPGVVSLVQLTESVA